jgi:transglutaminase-like putative cysteine protease
VPALAVQHLDHFGNHIDIYRIDKPHTRFDIEVRAAVEVSFADPPPAASTPPWEEIRAALTGDGFPEPVEASEFVYDSPLVPPVEALRAYGAKSFTPGRPILAAACELTSRIKADFEYHPGATDISTPLGEVFAGKAGVCQDFAHVEIAALRAHGLAARYVSGYIRTVHSKEEIALRGADASHAWVAVWCGEAAGWVQLDPTNDLVAKEDHVAVAWGRDFSDVSPLRGVILGGESHSYGVAVTLVPTT